METNSFVSTYRKRIDVVQNSVEQKLETNGDVAIAKVLCVNANACLDNIEVLNGEAYYSGEVVFDVVYTDEQGNLLNLTETANLQGKIENDFLNSTMLPVYKVEVVNVSIQNVSENALKVNAIVEITLDCLVNDNIEPYISNSDNIRTKTELVNVFSVKNNGQATFSISEDNEVKCKVDKILVNCANVCVKDVKSGTGYFTIEGEVCVNLCYVCGEEDNKTVKCLNQTYPFKEEVEAGDLTKEELVELMINVKHQDVNYITTEIDDSKTNINVNIPINVKYFILSNNERVITTDAYSTTHNINLVSESFSYINNIQTICETKSVDCELTLQEDQARISKILFVCGENVSVTNNYIEEDKLYVEGIITANVIYLADDDNYDVCSVVVENPFKVCLNNEVFATENIFVKTGVKGCSFRAKKGKEIELDFDINLVAEVYSNATESYLKEVVLTEELQASNYSLQIYFAPANADIWNISKQLKVNPDTILQQNPNLVFPLQKPEQIVYFIQNR